MIPDARKEFAGQVGMTVALLAKQLKDVPVTQESLMEVIQHELAEGDLIAAASWICILYEVRNDPRSRSKSGGH